MANTALQEALKKHDNLRGIVEKYPSQASSLVQTLGDLTHASQWSHLSLVDLEAIDGIAADGLLWPEHCGKALIIGLRPEARGLEAVWCCEMSDMLNTAIFLDIFTALDKIIISATADEKEVSLLRGHFLIAVHSTDATVVYYNMARGLVKPVN